MTSIRRARRDVHESFNHLLRYAEGADGTRLDAFEAEAWTGLLALGRALMVLFLARQAARPRAAGYVVDGVRYVGRGERTGACPASAPR